MAAFPGARVQPGDPRYGTIVRGFNQRWVGSPRRLVVCRTPSRCATGRAGVDDGLRITVRGGGHCYENFVSGTTAA